MERPFDRAFPQPSTEIHSSTEAYLRAVGTIIAENQGISGRNTDHTKDRDSLSEGDCFVSTFSDIAKQCAAVVQEVLDGDSLRHEDIRERWPSEASDYPVFDELWDDLIEFGNPGAESLYRPLLQEVAQILADGPSTQQKAQLLIAEASERWDKDE